MSDISYKAKYMQIKEHLEEQGSITTWEAITLYHVTRLGSVICDLRKKLRESKSNYIIVTETVFTKDKNGRNMHYAKYNYLSKEEVNKNEQDFHSRQTIQNPTREE